MKNAYFFPHDLNARNDPKLQNILMSFGCEGLGIYWCIIEMLYEQGGIMPMSDCKCIAFALHVESNAVQHIITDFELFRNDGDKFWSDSVRRRLDRRSEISEKRREAGKQGWKKAFSNYQPTDGQIGSIKSNAGQNTDNESANAKQTKSNCPAIKRKEIEINNKENIQKKNSGSLADQKEKETCQKKDERPEYGQFVELFNSECRGLPSVTKITDKRRDKIRARLQEADLGTWKRIFERMNASKFCNGENSSGWKASFDWITDNSDNYNKVLEGNYDNWDNKQGKGGENAGRTEPGKNIEAKKYEGTL